MSIVYYERLERGRGPMPSTTMLAGLARALRLTDDQRKHLCRLAEQHEETALAFVADLRTVVARRGNDRRAVELVEALRHASADFSAKWDEHVVSALHCSVKRFDHDRVGREQVAKWVEKLANYTTFKPDPQNEGMLTMMLDQLVSWSTALRSTRNA
jgi:transcriptional regulator with XRE-family HTH domain